jgi:hypothetical protein
MKRENVHIKCIFNVNDDEWNGIVIVRNKTEDLAY